MLDVDRNAPSLSADKICNQRLFHVAIRHRICTQCKLGSAPCRDINQRWNVDKEEVCDNNAVQRRLINVRVVLREQMWNGAASRNEKRFTRERYNLNPLRHAYHRNAIIGRQSDQLRAQKIQHNHHVTNQRWLSDSFKCAQHTQLTFSSVKSRRITQDVLRLTRQLRHSDISQYYIVHDRTL